MMDLLEHDMKKNNIRYVVKFCLILENVRVDSSARESKDHIWVHKQPSSEDIFGVFKNSGSGFEFGICE